MLRLAAVCAGLTAAEALAEAFEIHVSDRSPGETSSLEQGSAADPFRCSYARRSDSPSAPCSIALCG